MDIRIKDSDNGQPVPRFGSALMVCAALTIALCIYQWVELIEVRKGNTTPLCTLSEAVDCAAVWNSPLSNQVQRYTGIPVAGWGLAWGLITFILAAIMLNRNKAGKPVGVYIQALQLTSGTAAIISILLLSYSIAIAVFCPSCLVFYLLVAITTALALRRSAPGGNWSKAIAMPVAVFIPVFAMLLIPGMYTPQAAMADTLENPAGPATAAADEPLARFIESQPREVRQLLADTLHNIRNAPRISRPGAPERLTWGSPTAPMHLVEWIEIRCPHCRDLHQNLERLQSMAPPAAWNVETRFFPLDSECNPAVSRSDGTGVSCLAARLLICLAGKPQEPAIRATMFQHQRQLTTGRIWDIAARHDVEREELENCVDSPETMDALQRDIDYAAAHRIEGTPLVVINGRKASALPHLIFALILSQGHTDHPAFERLPPPQTSPPAS